MSWIRVRSASLRRIAFACFAILISWVGPRSIWALPGEAPEGEQFFKQVDAAQAAELESTLKKLYAAVAPSVVRVYSKGDPAGGWVSGVIVSNSGEIFTCAHHDHPPDTKVTVELYDGSRVAATTRGLVKNPKERGVFRAHDVSLIQLDERRDWPAVPIGLTSDLDNGQFCVAVGNPACHRPEQPPLLRLGRILPPRNYGHVRSSCRILSGDSGGPLFDLQGRVLGVLSSYNSFKWAGCEYSSSEVFERFRERLRAGEEIIAVKPHLGRPLDSPHDAFGAFEASPEFANTFAAARESTVEVLRDGVVVGLGTVVDAGGLIITKRTEIIGYEKLVCRTADGRELPGKMTAESAEHDVALVAVDADDLRPARWAESDAVEIGQIVASIGPKTTILPGVVGGMQTKNPPIKGQLPINGMEKTPPGQTGLAFTKVWDQRPDVGRLRESLRPGDFIVQLDETPTPTVEAFVQARTARLSQPMALVGERIILTVRRDAASHRVVAPLISEGTVSEFQWKQSPLSLRRNGFPEVFSHDGGIPPDLCGGPVVNRSGAVVGINIARADEVQSFVIPTSVVRQIVDRLKKGVR